MRKGGFSKDSLSLPAELFPDKISMDGISFKMGGKLEGQKNVMACNGQKINLPKTGNYNHIYILAAATRDTGGAFKAGQSKKNIRVQSYNGKIGQFDKRA